MNRVTSGTPLDEVLALERRDGYVLMEDALTPGQIAEIRAAYDAVLAQHPRQPGATRVEVKRILEQGPVFEQLLDNPPVFAVARGMIGVDLDLGTAGELDHKFAGTPAYISWHNDFLWMVNTPYPRQNFWVRCVYFIDDVTPDMGPFTLVPGSHLADGPPPADATDENRQPRMIPGALPMTGKAGSCIINNTEIWHTNTPNRSDRDRRLIMVIYKHSWMKPWEEGYGVSPEFASRQTDPVRQQLCGRSVWHRGEQHFPARDWRPTGVAVGSTPGT